MSSTYQQDRYTATSEQMELVRVSANFEQNAESTIVMRITKARRPQEGAKHTFSLAMVWMTSSGGVPRSCVMIEN